MTSSGYQSLPDNEKFDIPHYSTPKTLNRHVNKHFHHCDDIRISTLYNFTFRYGEITASPTVDKSIYTFESNHH